jgi:hypothetical protein
MFMEMVWKTHTKVSIGYIENETDKKSFVVYWFCPKRKDDSFDTHR